jgi:eukaryotic-like serine/threonine-protein kinase
VNPIQVIDGKYQIVRQLGEGGMGAVYEARHLGTGRRVAVKVIVSEALMKNSDMVARFQREARAAGSIESQHIAHILDTGFDRENGYPYMVMEYLQGEDVSQAIARLGPIHPDLALRIVGQACIGLQRAHEAGVTHRDIKPANLYIAQQDGGDVLVKLLDFGIAKVKIDQMMGAENAALTRTGSMLGSPLYMSPEQAKGSKTADHRTDVWSLGVVLYEALSGITPHGHCETLGGLILAICSEEPRVVQDHAPWVAPEVAAIVHRALAIDVNRRFQSAGEMGAAIRGLLPNGQAIHTGMITPLAPNLRAMVAPRLATTAPAAGITAPHLAGAITGAGSTTPGTNTAAGFSQSHATSPKRSALPAVLATLLVVGGGGFGAYHFLLAKHQEPAATVASAAVVPPSPSASATAPPQTPDLPKLVRLAIVAPTDTKVEIDDAAAQVTDGGVDLTGALGSTHHVKLSRGKVTTAADVAITNDGAIPSKIELGTSPAAPLRAGLAVAIPPKTGAPPQGGANPAPPPATPRPTPPTQPQVSRDFN